MNLRVVARDADFAGEMDMRSLTIAYLKEHYAADLGKENVALLDEPQGLEMVQLRLFAGEDFAGEASVSTRKAA